MGDRNLTNVAASVHDRLLGRARETGRPFNELLQYWAIERFLFRLAQTRHAEDGDFVLKGALLLQARGAATGRPTRDIDLLRRGGPAEAEQLVDIVRACCRVDVADDGMRFDPESIEAEQISRDAEYEGVRIRFRGYLGNARVPMQLDVGVGDAVVPGPVAIEYPELLPGYGRPQIRGYTLESLIAEKFQVLVSWAEANTRMKDFYDLAFLARRFPFDGARIAGALSATFERRGTSLPASREDAAALGPAFYEDQATVQQWEAFLRKARLGEEAPPSSPEGQTPLLPEELVLGKVCKRIAAFLLPPSETLAAEEDPFEKKWRPGGPWRARNAGGSPSS